MVSCGWLHFLSTDITVIEAGHQIIQLQKLTEAAAFSEVSYKCLMDQHFSFPGNEF